MHPELLKILLSKADSNSHVNYPTFIQTVLYTPQYGYYTKNNNRIGRKKNTDFYTAQSLGNIFRSLILEHCTNQLGDQISQYSFVELAVDSIGLFQDQNHPFKDYIPIGPLDTPTFPEKSFIFANELFDAIPFHRFIFKNGKWHERGVLVSDTLQDVILESPTIDPYSFLPKNNTEGYEVDLQDPYHDQLKPLQTVALCNASFLFLDYGLYFNNLINNFPQGTARGYHQHKQISDILSHPGDMDITNHICWDHLINNLQSLNFKQINLHSQEAFFIKNCPNTIKNIIENGSFQDKRTLTQLLHPAHMGSKFQALWGT